MPVRKITMTVASAVALIVPTTASAASHAPNVRCWQLDKAERKLHAKGFRTVERGEDSLASSPRVPGPSPTSASVATRSS